MMMLSRSLKTSTNLSRYMASIARVGIVGMGSMGHGIAQAAAEGGYQVVAVDLNKEALDKGIKAIKTSVEKIAGKKLEKGEAPEKVEAYKACLKSITAATDVSALKDCDLVIEAIIENIDIKRKFYADLNTKVKSSAIFASNTSSLPINDLALASTRLDRTIGLHFFNPVQMMKLVEVVRTDKTDATVYKESQEFVKKIGKVAVACKDTPGFVVNRLLVPYMSQALLLLERGDADIEGIDNAMMLGAGHPMGPLKLCDYVGLDITLAILEGWKTKFPNEPAFIVPEILRKKVKEGKLGKKTGAGFYLWDGLKTKGLA